MGFLFFPKATQPLIAVKEKAPVIYSSLFTQALLFPALRKW